MKSFIVVFKYIIISFLLIIFTVYINNVVFCGSEISKEILRSKFLTDQTMMRSIKLSLKNNNNYILADVMFHKIELDYTQYITKIKVLNKEKFEIENNEATAMFQHILMTICLKHPSELILFYTEYHKNITGLDLTKNQTKQIYDTINNLVVSFILTKAQIYDIISTNGQILNNENIKIANILLNNKFKNQYISNMLQITKPSIFFDLILNYNNTEKLKSITNDFEGLEIFLKELNESSVIEELYFKSIQDLLLLTAPEIELSQLNLIGQTELLSGEIIINNNYSFNDLSGAN